MNDETAMMDCEGAKEKQNLREARAAREKRRERQRQLEEQGITGTIVGYYPKLFEGVEPVTACFPEKIQLKFRKLDFWNVELPDSMTHLNVHDIQQIYEYKGPEKTPIPQRA